MKKKERRKERKPNCQSESIMSFNVEKMGCVPRISIEKFLSSLNKDVFLYINIAALLYLQK